MAFTEERMKEVIQRAEAIKEMNDPDLAEVDDLLSEMIELIKDLWEQLGDF